MSSFKQPENHEAKETSSLTRGASWRCQDAACGKVTLKPYRWVVGSKTTLACDSCGGKVKEIGRDGEALSEEVLKRMSLLEQQLMALKQRMDDQLGKP